MICMTCIHSIDRDVYHGESFGEGVTCDLDGDLIPVHITRCNRYTPPDKPVEKPIPPVEKIAVVEPAKKVSPENIMQFESEGKGADEIAFKPDLKPVKKGGKK
jgi:hypothetical protein